MPLKVLPPTPLPLPVVRRRWSRRCGKTMLLLAQVVMQPLLLTQTVTPRTRRMMMGLRLLQPVMTRLLLTQRVVKLP